MTSYLKPWTTLAVGIALGYFVVPMLKSKISG